MDQKDVIKAYLYGLETNNHEGILRLFAPHAIVNSPLYGKTDATRFYNELFSDTQSSKITLKNIFSNIDNPNCAAAHFIYTWKMKDGALSQFECIDLFEFEPSSGKITSLTIIYDTYHTRKNFENIHS